MQLVFKYSESSYLVPIGSKCSAVAGFSNNKIDRLEYFEGIIPFAKKEVSVPKFETPFKIQLSEQQKYLQNLKNAFNDPYITAGLAQKPPCLFLKEEVDVHVLPRN